LTKRIWLLAGVLLALAFGIVACGDDDEEPAGSGNQAAENGGSDEPRAAEHRLPAEGRQQPVFRHRGGRC
jgi:hypothetical protein